MKLNVGCGNDIKKGWINLDIAPVNGVDVVHNIENLPLPFDSNVFDEILCRNILEHVEYIPVLKELNRILKEGGSLVITVPHFTSVDNFIDPTHKKMFSWRTFFFFSKQSWQNRSYYFDFSFSSIKEISVRFNKGVFFYNYLVEPVVNLHPRIKDVYEITFLSRLFPAQYLHVHLIK